MGRADGIENNFRYYGFDFNTEKPKCFGVSKNQDYSVYQRTKMLNKIYQVPIYITSIYYTTSFAMDFF